MKTKHWPDKTERQKRFGSVPPTPGNKPIHKEEMTDLQNMPHDFLFALDSVGICNVKHPLMIHSDLKPYEQTTVGTFSLTTSLEQRSKGINMSRLTEVLHEYHQAGFTLNFNNLQAFTADLAGRMEQSSAHVHVTFPWFFARHSPALNKIGLGHAEALIKVHFDQASGFTHEVGLTAAVTTLCPCSKEISEYSAHNQRGYVTMNAELYDPTVGSSDWKVTLLQAAESNASSILYPVLKRPDEKAVTEKAYENPRFVEDMVRLIAADLYEDETIKAFTVACRNEESIHQHDAIATLTYSKDRRP
ncbi:GTP cyclohydrolase I [Evansella caseinilytica]|uniref:GTP cyclohydrolase FolE2 n=1 Tax=Evansella caseinilytica TaxID=1503961 RepID=A0A1H3SWI0_9BACI|nr:GTP cyclohydrolase FolE2 [Evansella caseinilytica]SDZ41895.1 GTP cyclohydrolase I [Evansella caseinilytica]